MQKIIPVTVIEFLNFSAELLKEKGISEARLNAELILCEILNCNRVNIYLNFEKPLSKNEISLLKEYLTRRIKHEPLQYILGKTSFYGLEIKLNKNVLIPRPETELLVEKILSDIRKNNKSYVSIFEIGTGSGCISIALAKSLQKDNTGFDIFSIDISGSAIEIANENLKVHNLETCKIRFIEKDVFEIEKLKKDFDYVISNPPYISFSEYNLLESEVKDYEPGLALTDFENGLKYYKKIFSITSDKKFSGKVFCEIGFGQRGIIEDLLKEFGFTQYVFYKDYNSIDRILEIIK